MRLEMRRGSDGVMDGEAASLYYVIYMFLCPCVCEDREGRMKHER